MYWYSRKHIRIINKLKQIALNKDILFSEENIELLIQNEEDKKLEGFLQRVESLKKKINFNEKCLWK